MDTILFVYSQYPWLYFFLLIILSLLVGSFLNVLIYRLPIMLERSWRAEYEEMVHPDEPQVEQPRFNLFLPRSACPHCGHLISALENIPIISWLCLRGRCKSCQQPISARYPLVELLTGICGGVVAFAYEPGWAVVGALLLTWTLIGLTFIDLDKYLLPDALTLPLLWLGLLFNLRETFVSLEDAVLGAMAGYLILWCLYWLFKLLTGKEGMGYGDFKLLAALGAFVGWKSVPLILFGSSIVGTVCALFLIVTKKQQASKAIPFGPYLAIAGWITLLWGHQLIAWYLGLLL
jgi:leader peptidase (prepilin peptidase)/N-methyltransferase